MTQVADGGAELGPPTLQFQDIDDLMRLFSAVATILRACDSLSVNQTASSADGSQ